ncbi:MAG TPA: hypothetical protein DCP92_02250 [Nitrospiraceae bacterium]|jgi:3-hydroxyacyl-[acyl-carrier-protein] dehydratase|nr:hypothetical protein [Nitrospiraceae bacterium]
MRFLFYDSVTHIEKGISITGVKSFSLTEEFLRGHYAKRAIVPGVLLIEAMAQLLGWLIIYSHDFKLSTFLVLAEDAVVTPDLRPGFSAEIHAELISTSKRDSLGRVRMCVGGREIAHVNRIIYGHVSEVKPEDLRKLFGYYSGLNGAVL